MSDQVNNPPNDASEEVAQLRAQVQSLMNDKVAPALSSAATQARNAAESAKTYVQDARELYDEQSAVLSERVREAPIVAMLVAVGAGYILGRIAR